MSDERPLLDTVLAMTADSIERAGLDVRDVMMVRIAALAAVDAPPGSYLLNLAAAADSGMTRGRGPRRLDRGRSDHRHAEGGVCRQRDRHRLGLRARARRRNPERAVGLTGLHEEGRGDRHQHQRRATT